MVQWGAQQQGTSGGPLHWGGRLLPGCARLYMPFYASCTLHHSPHTSAPLAPQELECGLLFPRFRTIRDVSAKLAAATADFMCATGLGAPPADFDAVVAGASRAGAAATLTGLGKWEAYVRAHMFIADSPKL